MIFVIIMRRLVLFFISNIIDISSGIIIIAVITVKPPL